MINIISEKYNKIANEGAQLTPKQMGYIAEYYELTVDSLELFTYVFSEEEVILFAPTETMSYLEGIAGYDFSPKNAKIYVNTRDEALMVVDDQNDIKFFKEVFIDSKDSEQFDNEGNFIEEE
jgi:hypothetical protein